MTTTQTQLILNKIDTKFGFSEIQLDKINIVTKYSTVFHIINPKEIELLLDDIEINLKQSDLRDKIEPLEHQIRTIRNKINTLIPHRQKRGLFNFMGTIQKWIYGTMDNVDRQEIQEQLLIITKNNKNLIEGHNSQIKINSNFNETFIKLKEAIEKDRTSISELVSGLETNEKILKRQIQYLDFVLKLKILQDNVEHLQDNISSSRLGIIHSNILTNDEIIEYDIDLYKLENIKMGTLIDNKDNIIFVLRIPKNIINVQKLLLIPVGDENFKELMFETIEIIRINNKTYNFEKNKNLNNLKLLNNCLIKKNCLTIYNNASETIELRSGLILLKNSNNMKFKSSCDERKILLKGNYLINFNNCSIKINEYVYENYNKNFKQSLVIPNLMENIKESNKKLLFDDLVLSQVENLKEIKEIEYKKHNHFIYGSLISVLSTFLIIFVVIIFCKHKRLKVNVKNITQESSESRKGGVTSVTFRQNIEPTKFDQLPVNQQYQNFKC